MAFGKEIKRLREKASWSAQKAADQLGVKVERLRKWEQRDLDPRDEDATLIEKYFNLPIAEIKKVDDIRKFHKVPNSENRKESTAEDDYKEKYIRLLEELRKQDQLSLTALKEMIDDLHESVKLNQAEVLTVGDCLKVHRMKLEKGETIEKLEHEANTFLAANVVKIFEKGK
jgi:transcriptional regulator with XRE-family HTH domain